MGWPTQRSYWHQAVKKRERMLALIQAGGFVLLTAWLYYRSFGAAVFLLPLLIWKYRLREEEYMRRKKSEFLLQFKEMIQDMASALNSGYSVENALRETQKEMRLLYSPNAVISKELERMVRQMRLQMPIEQVLEEFAGRVELEDVRNFAAVFSAAKRSGGDMIGIIQDTVGQIGDKIEVHREIDTILAAKKYEFKVMSAIPYGIILYLILSFPEFTACLYGNIAGIGVMTVCLMVYTGACVIGAKLVDIEV